MLGPLAKPHISYQELCELPPDGNRYELFEGKVYAVPSPDFLHQRTLGRLFRLFADAIRDRSEVIIAPMDVVLGEDAAYQPDLIFIREQNREIIKNVIQGSPDLVVEVLSSSTMKRDRGPKMEIYARYRIEEYWLVDLDQRAVEIYRLDKEAEAFRLVETCRTADSATSPLLPTLSVDVDSLFAD